MSAEVYRGTTNTVVYDTQTGKVTKMYAEGNGIGRACDQRIIAEARSMTIMPLTPHLYDMSMDTLVMSYVDGEKYLDTYIRECPQSFQESVYQKSGEVLRTLHDTKRQKMPVSDHEKHMISLYSMVAKNSVWLKKNDIDPVDLLKCLEVTYQPELVEDGGYVWTHGDYWLNNVIGKERGLLFEPEGIIDWEMAGIGSPYKDFAVVHISIERSHEGATDAFWKGYGMLPDSDLLFHFSCAKVLEWMTYDDAESNGGYSSDLFQKNFSFIRSRI